MSRLKAKALTHVAARASAAKLQFKSVALLTEALRRDPSNPTILLNLATAHGRRRDYDQAEKFLARLLELSPRKARIYHQVARAYVQIDRTERAVECYRRAVELSRDGRQAIPMLLELARLYERRHQLDDAAAIVTEALEQDPANEHARLDRAVLDARRGQTAQADADLRALLGDASCSQDTRVQAGYELAQLLDKEEQYDGAFQALLVTKRLFKSAAPPFRLQSRRAAIKNQELLAMLDRSYFDRWKELARHDSPYRFAVLTGHPRSGTTLVEQVLDSHQELISADEHDVFIEWVYAPIVRRFPFSESLLSIFGRVPPIVRQQARATYWQRTEAIFDEPIGERMLLDKNPGMAPMLPIVNWLFPEMRMLIALRDPRDVILSCFMQKVYLTSISVNWLSLADAANYYASSMSTWLALRRLTPSSWLEFRYEDVVVDLEGHARQILDFLELPWDDRVLKFYEHAREKLVRSPTYKDVTRPVYQRSVGRWQHYERHLQPILKTLEPFVKEFGYAQ